ncbi:GNAT family N-acetyltransferase [Nonomuraea phyllanthi]|uniref:GNAT family N-acetyltransferase n=1 Tax=Nonomuraea phyllanthi TaxID=2219224 RepID=A0A5C4VW28_9ACTN|nr:GNAT family N-acetyltransferase [Nonomuraea phyllanthi]KAB8190243.1 GNAT family N-acetyltransferase [Nonomuraea phyllanthi]QFY05486.1 GNAT family N-acetyltransferase [Nonomuraea phyllanthi]
MVVVSPESVFDEAEIFELYDSVGWEAFTRDIAKLKRSMVNSHLVITARDESGKLLGLARTVSDDEMVCYVQELLVNSAFHGQGIGRRLLEHLMERYAHCRHFILTTDHESTAEGAASHAFYRRMGLIEHHEQKLSAFGLRIGGSSPA